MGFTFRKSIKIGKNTRVNLSSKGGIGISTGIKGARVSVNKQGANVYGGKGVVRYQKQLYCNDNNNNNNNNNINESNQYENKQISKGKGVSNFVKKHYKECIIIFIGFIIGGVLGGIGRVTPSLSEDVNTQIEENRKIIDTKKDELVILNNKKIKLEKAIN